MKLLELLKNKKEIARESWSIGWYMTLIMFFIFLIGISDVYIAGKFGKEAQSAYGFAFQLYFVFGVMATVIGIGAVSVISKLFTSGKGAEFDLAVGTSLIVTAVTGFIFSLTGAFFSKIIINNLNMPLPLKGFTQALFVIYSTGLLFNYLLYTTNGILRASKLIKKSLLTMALVSSVNIILNFFLAFHTPLGFRGIAFATVISTFLGSLLNIIYLRKLINKVRFSFSILKQILAIGWPIGLLQIFWQISSTVLYVILGLLKTHNIEIMAAFTNGLKVESIVFLPAFAFNMANAALVGNLLGKNRAEDAYFSGIVTAGLGVIIVTVLAILTMCSAGIIANLLSSDIIVIKESVRYIYISLISEPFMAWSVILSGGLNGAGDTKSVMVIIALSVWLVRIPLAYILGIVFGFGAISIWWAMNLSIFVQSIFISKHYFSKKWVNADYR